MHPSNSSSKDLYKNAGSWHGTGRYKYENGQVVDVLKGILDKGTLSPYYDAWDQKRSVAHSISTARSRAYGRLYASLFFPRKQRRLRELWNRFLWSCRYLLPSLWTAWVELVPIPFVHDYKKKAAASAAKFSHKHQSFFYLFLWGGTDIPANYPILIGVKRLAYATTSGSRYVDLHEDRAVGPISIRDFTHIEVPRDRMIDTQQVLRAAGCELPVIALEDGDRS